MHRLALCALLAPLGLLSLQLPERTPVPPSAEALARFGFPLEALGAGTQDRIYLEFRDPDVLGDAISDAYAEHHEAADYSLGASATLLPPNGGDPRRVSDQRIGPLSVTGLFLRGLPEFAALCAEGRAFDRVTLYRTSADRSGREEEFVRLDLEDVLILSVQSDYDPQELFRSKLVLDFDEIAWTYWERLPNGDRGRATSGRFTNPSNR